MKLESLERQVKSLSEAVRKTRLLVGIIESRLLVLEKETDAPEAVKTASGTKSDGPVPPQTIGS